MDNLVNMVAQRAGLSEDKARTAVDTGIREQKKGPPYGRSATKLTNTGGPFGRAYRGAPRA